MTTLTIHHAGTCAYCEHQGLLGFWRCADGRTIVLVCDECETTYASPAAKDGDAVEAVEASPSFSLPNLNTALAGGRWATRDEIAALGWAGRIEGEYDSAAARVPVHRHRR